MRAVLGSHSVLYLGCYTKNLYTINMARASKRIVDTLRQDDCYGWAARSQKTKLSQIDACKSPPSVAGSPKLTSEAHEKPHNTPGIALRVEDIWEACAAPAELSHWCEA